VNALKLIANASALRLFVLLHDNAVRVDPPPPGRSLLFPSTFFSLPCWLRGKMENYIDEEFHLPGVEDWTILSILSSP